MKMEMNQVAQFYVEFIVPGVKVFLMFMLVMFVIAFWAKAKEGKLIDMAGVFFETAVNYTYKFFYYVGLGIWMFFVGIVRIFRVVMATVRDFFMSRI